MKPETHQAIAEFLAFRSKRPPHVERMLETLRELIETVRQGRKPDSAPLVSVAKEVVALVGRFKQVDPDDGGASVLVLNAFCPEEEPVTETFCHEEHLLNTAVLSAFLCLERFGEGDRLEELTLAALIHDVGMTLMPSPMFSPEKTQLGPYDREILKQHPVESASMISSWDEPLAHLSTVIAQEHERVDGSGYPHGLRGEEVSLEARVLGLVDTYEAMTHHRPYRGVCAPHDAMRVILAVAPRLFGRELLQLAVRRFTMYPVGSVVELSSTERGVVVQLNHDAPMRPQILVLGAREGWRPARTRRVNLKEHQLVHILPSATHLEEGNSVVVRRRRGP